MHACHESLLCTTYQRYACHVTAGSQLPCPAKRNVVMIIMFVCLSLLQIVLCNMDKFLLC